MPKLKRINARVTSELNALIQELANARGVSISDIIVTALKDFCSRQSQSENHRPYELFKKAGLIGCFEGGGKLSRDYKKTYLQLLDEKRSRS